jgi:NRAMP (natural resistance-associated macrophage protein)-like metal ion transporter
MKRDYAEPPLGPSEEPQPRGLARVVGAGVITGAADDDPSAIATYATAGAKFGLAFLWIAPVLLPMMFIVTYLAAKLGRVYGKGLIASIRDRYSGWLLMPLMVGAFTGNIIEAAANLGGIGAALNLLIPMPISAIVMIAAVVVLLLQVLGSYELIRLIFRWLALVLFAYVGAALLARPEAGAVVRATFVPRMRWDSEYLMMIVACIGTSLSAYVYTWQSNQEVEEQIAEGKRHWWQRRGASRMELARTKRDVVVGMIFANVILYFIILSTAVTLNAAGRTEIASAAEAAAALEPLAGEGAKLLFALGVVGVGMLAVPVMTTGAAYDLVQGLGGKGSLHKRLSQAKLFYGVIVVVTLLAVSLNFLGVNPIKAMVWSGIVQGFSVPPLLLVMMLMTNDRKLMGERANGWSTNLLGGVTTLASFAATGCLVWTWL